MPGQEFQCCCRTPRRPRSLIPFSRRSAAAFSSALGTATGDQVAAARDDGAGKGHAGIVGNRVVQVACRGPIFGTNRIGRSGRRPTTSWASVADLTKRRVGWPRAIARSGLPRIRTCSIRASGSSSERFVKTIKYECLNQFVIFGERHIRYLIKEFVEHYLTERFHQGIGVQLIRNQPGSTNDNGTSGRIACRSCLRRLLNYYHREAA